MHAFAAGALCPISLAGHWQVDLTVRIREILLSYPSGIAILKELLQVGAVPCTMHAWVVTVFLSPPHSCNLM